MANLVNLDSLEIVVIIDNELDPISASQNPAVKQSGSLKDVGLSGPQLKPDDRGGAERELRMDGICCGAHGLSLMITGIKGEQRHTILFDVGPEEHSWERNANRLQVDIGKIEAIQLSHWHRDHSGGMLKVLDMIADAKKKEDSKSHTSRPVDVDLHPNRPHHRGMRPPGFPPISMEADPTFEEIEQHRGIVRKNDQPHTVLDNFFLISGEIPRVTEYEKGLKYGVRFNEKEGEWEEDEKMADERFLMCKIKGAPSSSRFPFIARSSTDIVLTDKGVVMFTGCSHAGVVNASTHAKELGAGTPLYAVMGGFHLADAEPLQIEATANDLKALGAQVLLTGHCTGWRAKFAIQKVMPDGGLVPSFVGSRYAL